MTLVYASEPLASAVSIFSLGSKGFVPAGQLVFSDYPIGVTVDAAQRLYVAVTSLGASGSLPNDVEVFPRGATKPSKTYSDGLTGPDDVAVDSHGTLYVANISNFGCADDPGDGDVVEYAKGSMKPTLTITDIPGCPHALGLDASDNLYVTYIYYGSSGPSISDVIEYARGSTKGKALGLHAKDAALSSLFWRVAVDGSGNVIVANDAYDNTLGQILVYPPGSTSPSKSIEYVDWGEEYFALQGDRIFAEAYTGQTVSAVPAEFTYPSGQERLVASPKLVPPAFYYGFAVSPR